MSLFAILQTVIAIALIILILLQERSIGGSALFGGGESGFYQTRRGFEKGIFIATLVLLGLFAALSLLNLIG